ncbi:hypothetical protein GCM10017044_01640 [Kordiimonas sediminis]|uniref:histidine kinase n=1 Tax=Kordiimonas sediminis TaxID=1735581 RepID=A0A919AK82_9PROT|nr:ATP-binding protein [Kordiimonas sediminis]GHF11536.1 hypothetical protein GCM10017044_01640 [Kordiimonas sediminis]
MTPLKPEYLPDLNWMPLPALLVGYDRHLVAFNRQFEDMFPSANVGLDMSMVIRDPGFLDAIDRVVHTNERLTSNFSTKGQAERHFTSYIQPLVGYDDLLIISLYETTKAYESERMRSTFVADVSHELRSPLTTMIATLETLKGRAGEDKATRDRFVDMTAAEAGRMHRIVNDLLALSATEARKHITPSERVSLKPILESIIKLVRERAAQKGMTVQADIASDLPAIAGETDQLTQVFQNLIDNAINYGDRSTDLKIRLFRDAAKNMQGVSVTNFGNVISPDHIPRLTERFYRVDSSRSRHLGGTGLGLAIVKHILGRHKGRLSVESSEESGTIFTVYLPEK